MISSCDCSNVEQASASERQAESFWPVAIISSGSSCLLDLLCALYLNTADWQPALYDHSEDQEDPQIESGDCLQMKELGDESFSSCDTELGENQSFPLAHLT